MDATAARPALCTAFKRDQREGYASRFYDFLLDVCDGDEFLARINPDSDKSGAAMRAGPIGVYSTVAEVIQRATTQAATTHNTVDGINAAVAAALMVHYFIYQLGEKAALGQFVSEHVPGPWTVPWQGKVGALGIESVHAALTAVVAHDSLSEILRACVAFTGDVDTVATIALAAGSCAREIAQDLPGVLVEGLENGAFGREYLSRLDTQLMGRMNRPV